MGLAGPRKRTKISHDPNNSTWSRSTTNYGHKIMTSQGWTPGSFLGASNSAHAENFTAASASHVRVVLKDDNLGLGAKPHGKKAEDEPTGLDAFQDLLGRLNGKTDTDIAKEQRKREDVRLIGYVEKRWKTMTFVKGGVLAQEKMPESSDSKPAGTQPDSASSQEDESKKSKKRRKKERVKNAEPEAESKDTDTTSDGNLTNGKPTKLKKEKKKRKKDRKHDALELEKNSGEITERSAKSKKRKRKEKDGSKSSDESSNGTGSRSPEVSEVKSPVVQSTKELAISKDAKPVGRHAIRARYIQQKKRALMDDKSLNEIFMIKS